MYSSRKRISGHVRAVYEAILYSCKGDPDVKARYLTDLLYLALMGI